MLTIKEYDVITSNPDYKDDKYLRYLSHEHFVELDEFVRSNTPDEDAEEIGALDFFKAFSKKGVGDVIQAKNYVGLIQLESGYQVQILPKIDLINDDDTEHSTSRIFIEMLRNMKDFPGKVFNAASLKTERFNLYEIFIKMYVMQVFDLVKHGLKSAYVRVEDNERFFKGKLLISENIKKNIAHKERFFVAYDEFQVNRPENRLIKSTLLKLQRLSSSSENIKGIRQLLTYFELVEQSKNIDKDFSLVVIDRNTKDYEDIMMWSKVFLKNKSFSTFSGNNKARALLFPMEKVYEAYVARNMADDYSELGWEVSAQDNEYSLFVEGKREVFSLRPDIVVTTNKRRYVMDTKWKRLKNDSGINYGISQADMYQMFAYSKKYGTPYIWLLYPITEDMVDHKPIVFKSGNGKNNEDETIVRIQFIDVSKINDSLAEIKEQILEIEKIDAFNIE